MKLIRERLRFLLVVLCLTVLLNVLVASGASAYQRTLKVTTIDAANIELCRTTLTLSWDPWYNGSRSMTTWAACPTPIVGTHWYRYSSYLGPISKMNGSPGYVSTYCNAKYYNDDFLIKTYRTWAYHYLTIKGYTNGTASFSGTYTSYSGEAWWMLFDKVSFY